MRNSSCTLLSNYGSTTARATYTVYFPAIMYSRYKKKKKLSKTNLWVSTLQRISHTPPTQYNRDIAYMAPGGTNTHNNTRKKKEAKEKKTDEEGQRNRVKGQPQKEEKKRERGERAPPHTRPPTRDIRHTSSNTLGRLLTGIAPPPEIRVRLHRMSPVNDSSLVWISWR